MPIRHYYIFYFQRRAFFIFRGIFWKRLRATVSVNTTFSEVFLCTPQLNQIEKLKKEKTRDRPAEPIKGPVEPICRAAAHCRATTHLSQPAAHSAAAPTPAASLR